MHKYDFESGKLSDEPIIKAIRGQAVIDYMEKLQWFSDNPMQPISVSETVNGKR